MGPREMIAEPLIITSAAPPPRRLSWRRPASAMRSEQLPLLAPKIQRHSLRRLVVQTFADQDRIPADFHHHRTFLVQPCVIPAQRAPRIDRGRGVTPLAIAPQPARPLVA